MQLQVLDLSGNAASLPEYPAFSSLPQLQELYLRRMQLCEVPSDILSLQQLRILDLSQNSLQLIPESLSRHLLEELEQAFLDEVESYREIHAAFATDPNFLVKIQFDNYMKFVHGGLVKWAFWNFILRILLLGRD